MNFQTQLAKEICLSCQFSPTETLCQILPKISESSTGKPMGLQGAWEIFSQSSVIQLGRQDASLQAFENSHLSFANYAEELEELKTETSASRHQKC